MKKGDIWWASLYEPRGSEPGYRRPVVIVSSNEFNVSNINTVIVTVITSSLNLAEAPGNFRITKKESGLSKESVVNVSQILTLDKSFLTEKIGDLPSKKIVALNVGLKLVLSI
ncbi:MAG: type II toxin-antitoxin system PemK/MazF family toxin [Candidatus Thiodiazotropha sp. (ex Lucinoma kastoroae)]|nr:type II toxin-antitoxin system PemK/MazF family toxin [Candidatus Thiodiazotropha sp. (ex Lucinoma kastoroae)]MCU7861526.1 type II toxin-antitoxin system PemK/MazF family toxin [Candidatus Thiodiazotropha sp. (ex Lucinoma kastoroae)]